MQGGRNYSELLQFLVLLFETKVNQKDIIIYIFVKTSLYLHYIHVGNSDISLDCVVTVRTEVRFIQNTREAVLFYLNKQSLLIQLKMFDSSKQEPH